MVEETNMFLSWNMGVLWKSPKFSDSNFPSKFVQAKKWQFCDSFLGNHSRTHIYHIYHIFLLYSHITLGVSLSFSIISTTSTERYTLPAEMWKDARRRGFSGEIFEKPSDHQKKGDMIYIWYIYILVGTMYIYITKRELVYIYISIENMLCIYI
jgi:hypothetical protein